MSDDPVLSCGHRDDPVPVEVGACIGDPEVVAWLCPVCGRKRLPTDPVALREVLARELATMESYATRDGLSVEEYAAFNAAYDRACAIRATLDSLDRRLTRRST